LEASLNQETALYEQLLELAREVERAAGREDAQDVCELMARKNALLAKLRDTSEMTDRLRQEFASHESVPDKMHIRVSEALERTSAVLEELLRVERATEQPLAAIRGSIQKELSEAGRGRRLLEGYRVRRAMEPQFMDKRR
jgi:hypothetical protein